MHVYVPDINVVLVFMLAKYELEDALKCQYEYSKQSRRNFNKKHPSLSV